MKHPLFACLLSASLAACSSAHTPPAVDAALDAGVDAAPQDTGVVDTGADAWPMDATDDSAPPMDAAIDSGVDAADACVPACEGRSCGEDGCGGLCGPVCAAGFESFEGFPVGPNFPETPFRFDSGLIWLAPMPNSRQAAVFHCADGTGFFGFLCADSASVIPDGNSLLIMDGLINPEKRFEFRFPGLVRSVSVAVTDTTGTEDEVFRLEALDASGAVVATDSTVSGPIADWSSNRLSVSVPSPAIVSVRIFSDLARVLSMDAFRWE